MNRSSEYKPGLFYFSLFALVWSGLLLFAGGFTTSIDAGMAFLDWPLSNGSLNPEGWLRDEAMRAEHSHRILGMKLGLLSIGLVVWTQLREGRAWVRNLAIVLLAVIISQGVLGGMRVRLDALNTGAENNVVARSIAVGHAIGAQAVLCLLVSLAVSQSKRWHRGVAQAAPPLPRRMGIATCAAIVVTIFVGAVMRHANAGMAIPYFPFSTADNSLIPDYWNWAVVLNFLHRALAGLVTILVVLFTASLWGHKPTARRLGAWVFVPPAIVIVQVFLGATVIWTQINAHAATLHMLTGAFLLAACWMLAFLALQPESAQAPAEAPAPTGNPVEIP